MSRAFAYCIGRLRFLPGRMVLPCCRAAVLPDDDEVTLLLEPLARRRVEHVDARRHVLLVRVLEVPVELAALGVVLLELAHEVSRHRVDAHLDRGRKVLELDAVLPGLNRVQFQNLPATVKVRIYTVAGDLVRELEKNDPQSGELDWDLKNANQKDVASGIYVFHATSSQGFEQKGHFVVIR